MTPEQIRDKIKGWLGLVLMFLPILRLVPVPWVQSVLDILGNSVIATAGTGGALLAANSGKVIGKKKYEV